MNTTTPLNAEAERFIRHAERRNMTVTVEDGVISIVAINNHMTIAYGVDHWSKRTRRHGAHAIIAFPSGSIKELHPSTFAGIICCIDDLYYAEMVTR